MSNGQLEGGTDRGPFCALCYDRLDRKDAYGTLVHLQRNHSNDAEFREFIAELVIRNWCSKCGTAFWSDVEFLGKLTYGSRPYCKDCRRDNRSFKDLLTNRIDFRHLLSRALHRPQLAQRDHLVEPETAQEGER